MIWQGGFLLGDMYRLPPREGGWTEIAVPVEVDVLARAESVKILRDRLDGLDEADADQLAYQLGDLPLAVTQAAAYLAQTGMPVREYLNLLATGAAKILDEGRPVSYPRSLVAATQLAVDSLTRRDRAAAQLAS